MSQGRYIEAEQSFHDALAQAEILPGKDDSAYTYLWTRLSMAQLNQEHWQDAEMSAAHHLAQGIDFVVLAAADVPTLRAYGRSRG